MKLINFVLIIFLALGLLAVPGVVFAQEPVSMDSGSIFSSDSSFLDIPLMKGGGGKGGGSRSSGSGGSGSDWDLYIIIGVAIIIGVWWIWNKYKAK